MGSLDQARRDRRAPLSDRSGEGASSPRRGARAARAREHRITASPPDPRTEAVASFDGTRLAARRLGEGSKLPVLLCNGVGANLAIWRRALIDVARERPVAAWDQRGLHSSGVPVSDRIDPGAHAEDAIAVADHFGMDRFAVASWSNGGRIALELAHREPERVTSLTIICGGFGHPLTRALRFLEIPSLLPTAAGLAKHFSTPLAGLFHGLIARPELAGLIRQSGIVGATADTPALVELFKGMADCDFRTLLATYEAVTGDSGEDILREIEAPALLIGGSKDPFTPVRMLEEMTRRIPIARLEIYENATHYLPIEFPARLSHDLRAFLDETEPRKHRG